MTRTYACHAQANVSALARPHSPELSGRALAENNVQFRRNCTYDPDPVVYLEHSFGGPEKCPRACV